MDRLQSARAPWSAGLVLVCRECDGYSKGLRRALKAILTASGVRETTRVVESRCLDICPKRATTIVTVGSDGPIVSLVPARVCDASQLAALVARFTRSPAHEAKLQAFCGKREPLARRSR